MNELLFILHALFISITALVAHRAGKEALTAFIALMYVLCNVLVLKQITLCGFNATAADALSIGAILGLNLLQEFYGRAAAIRAIWIGFVAGVTTTLLTQIHLMYTPSIHDEMHTMYELLFGYMPRIVCASLATYLAVQMFDSYLYARLKHTFNGRFFIIRNYISVGISQLLDTVLFSFLALYGTLHALPHIIVVSYCIKLAAFALATPCLALACTLTPSTLAQHEPI